MEVTLENVKSIFKEEVDKRVNVENMDPDKSMSDQGVDSLDRSSAFMALEDNFNVTISDLDMEKLDTLNKIVDFIKANQNS